MPGASAYPDKIDTSNELPKATDGETEVKAAIVNPIRDAVIHVETELGIQPSSTFTTVRARLDDLDTKIAELSDRISSLELSGGGGGIRVELNESTIVLSASTLNFTGPGVNVLDSGDNEAEIFISSGGGVLEQQQESIAVTSDGQTTFSLTKSPADDTAVKMYVNGLKQEHGVDYTVSGQTVTYTGTPLITSDDVEFWYIISGSVSSGGGETLAQTLAIGNESGGNNIVLSSGDNISSLDGTIRLDGYVTVNNNKIGNVSIPVNPKDAANKQYVDNQVGGIGNEVSFELNNNYSTLSLPFLIDPPYPFDESATITSVQIIRRVSGSSGDTRVDVLKNGVSIFASNGDKPQLSSSSANNATDTSTTFNDDSISAGDRLDIELETAETDAEDLRVLVRVE